MSDRFFSKLIAFVCLFRWLTKAYRSPYAVNIACVNVRADRLDRFLEDGFIRRIIDVSLMDRIDRDELAATLAVIEAERRGRSGSIQKPPRSLQAEMECEESGSSLGEQEDLRAEVARAVKRLKELCVHLRRGEDDSGLQSDCDESMLVIVNNNTAEAEEANTHGQETLPSSVRDSRNARLLFRLPVSGNAI